MEWSNQAPAPTGGHQITMPTFEQLQEKCKPYIPDPLIELIRSAYEVAKNAHDGQLRKSGDPYITHPLEVACILATLHQSPATIAAALLHDTLEDTALTFEDLEAKFGKDIAMLVEGVTKLGKLRFRSVEEEKAENLRKMILAMANDLRVVIIKIADRLHNMRTLKFLDRRQQIEMSTETREIFAPLAHRLGMWTIKWELDDLSFYYLQPRDFEHIKAIVAETRAERERYVTQFIQKVEDLLKELNVSAKVVGRPKHFYSIYQKLKKQGVSYTDLYDVLGIRVLVSSIPDCYTVLGVLHSAFKPISGRFKDYIAVPKPNLYQSLHTTVIAFEGKPVEIQIRTEQMHEIAEYGIAAHWKYKEGKAHTAFEGDFSWLRQIAEAQSDPMKPTDYLENLKVDLFIDEVFVFTPKGDVQELPKGATPIDFAYKIHTEIGHRCIGAKVDNRIVPLNYVLQNGQRVDVLTGPHPNPKLDWLSSARTGHAKNKIKQWFRKQNVELNREKGKEEVDKYLTAAGFEPKEILTEKELQDFLDKYHLKSIDDLILQVGIGEVSIKALMGYLEKTHPAKSAEEETVEDVIQKYKKTTDRKKQQSGVRVVGQDNIETYTARCCSPLPGDPIIGFVTMGHGISVHRTDCANIRQIPEADKARLVAVEWITGQTQTHYAVTLHIEGFDRFGLLKDIVSAITDSKINIKEVKGQTTSKGGQVHMDVVVETRNVEELRKLTHKLYGMPDIYAVSRYRY